MKDNMDFGLNAMLEQCVKRDASDLHICPDSYAYFRIHGELFKFGENVIPAKETEKIILAMLKPEQREVLKQCRSVDIAFSFGNAERFRAHIYAERRGFSMSARKLDSHFRTFSQLGLPQAVSELAGLRDGLVLVTGPTGSGKTTTLATLINCINTKRFCHILTIEDPIEYIHQNIKSLVHQRELHTNVGSFSEAVRASLREDPDVVLVGEMRDLDTMRTATTVAETGHLVFSTLHCGSAVGALDRLIGAFPADEQQSIAQQLSMVLRAVITQRLLPTADGKGRVPVVEVLQVTKAAANLIRNYKTEQLYSIMENGTKEGMMTLEQSLVEMVKARKVKLDDARRAAENVRVFDQRCRIEGIPLSAERRK